MSIIIISVLLIALVISMLIVAKLNKRVTSLSDELDSRTRSLGDANVELARLRERISLSEARESSRRQSDEARFKALASEILSASSAQIHEQQSRRLDDILKPLRENIEGFRQKVDSCYQTEARERFSLMKQIEQLVKANNSLGDEARQLSLALRGNAKMQGDWGEVILESILEKSGLRRDEEYFVQMTRDESGNTLRDEQGHGLRPDIVVKYPDGRCMVIDSKVSLTAYVDLVNADTPDAGRKAEERHLSSVRAHIKELAEKKYQDYVGDGKTEFVMLFIPNEGAYLAAMKAAPSLWQEAYDKRVLIVSPTHLVSALKLIAQLWSHDRQTRNAIEIATQAGRLYDKFAGFVADLNAIRKNIDNTSKSWDAAMNKLSDGTGNILSRIERLRELGAKATKQLSRTASDD